MNLPHSTHVAVAEGKDTAIRPFTFKVPDADLAELRRRIAATRWPEREPVADASQGVQLSTMQKLARYWANDYDWRKVEARLNTLPQFTTEINGLDIHFIHVRSPHPNAMPLIVTHGWPGSIVIPPDIDKAAQSGMPPSGLSADEQRAYDQLDFFYKHGVGYAQEMASRPQTLYGIGDSPVGLAAWLLDHDAGSYALIARVFDGQTEGLTRDDILDNITLYWLTNTTVSSARIYWENKLAFFAPKHVGIPVAVSAFPDEVVQTPRSWTAKAYPNLIYYNRPEKGGHFAAWEQPDIFAREVRAAFTSLR
jgi:epoxide hydrolase-like protein